MAIHWMYPILVIASLPVTIAAPSVTGRQLTGQEVFCLNLAQECPLNLLRGPVCASTAVDYPSECEFWRENCKRKPPQIMTLVRREPCTDDYCPQNCRGETKLSVCANYVNMQGVPKEKSYRNYCKYREAKCKQRNVFNIKLNFLYYGPCGKPRSTPEPEKIVTNDTAVPTVKEAQTTQMTDVDDEEMLATEYFEGTQVTDMIEGTQLITDEMGMTLYTDEMVGTLSTDEMVGTLSTDDMVGTLSTDEVVGTLSTEEQMVTELVETTLMYETDETFDVTVEGTQALDEEDGTMSTDDLDGTPPSPEELVATTFIFDEYDTFLPEDVTETTPLPDDEVTFFPEETDGTSPVFEVEETDAPVTENGTSSPDEMAGTHSPEALEETAPPDMLTSAPEEVPEIVELLQQCLAEHELCLSEVPSTTEAVDIVMFFYECVEVFGNCLATDSSGGNIGIEQEPQLGPSK